MLCWIAWSKKTSSLHHFGVSVQHSLQASRGHLEIGPSYIEFLTVPIVTPTKLQLTPKCEYFLWELTLEWSEAAAPSFHNDRIPRL